VHNLQSTSLELTWPQASDDVGIERYVITLDGVEATTTTGGLTSATIGSLSPVTTYLLTIWAEDLAGNPSPPLSVTITTLDGGPPTWQGAALSATAGITDVHLIWTSAVDDVTVTAYRVFQNGEQISELTTTELLVEGLGPNTEYSFQVEAGDAAGNWSEGGPSAIVTTARAFDPGFKRLTQEQFHRSLSDLLSYLWIKFCNHEPTYGPQGCGDEITGWGSWSKGGDPAEWYHLFSERHYGDWNDYRNLMPADRHIPDPGQERGGYRRFDMVVHDEHLSGWVTAVMLLAQKEIEDYFGRGDKIILNPCKKENDLGITNFGTIEEVYQNCASNFITDFGMRAYRQPLNQEEHARLMAIYDEVDEKYAPEDYASTSDQAFNRASRGLRNVIATILLSPKFLYRVELGDENGQLTTYELASRLSFHFWNSIPDDELFATAADGSLFNAEVYQAQVDRLASDPRAQSVIEEFYSDYFRIQDIPDITLQDGPTSNYAKTKYHTGPNEEMGIIAPTTGSAGNHHRRILEASQSELVNLGAWFTNTNPGTFEEMFRSNLHFLECMPHDWKPDSCTGAGPWSRYSYDIQGNCADVAQCYADEWVNANTGWDGVSEPITLPETERAGLLTRVAFLSHDTPNMRPIRRGLKIREMLLCDPIPPPENCDVVKPPNVTGMCVGSGGSTYQSCSDDQHCEEGETCEGWDKEVTMTVREKVEELTETPNTSCAGCHSTFINGLGYALNHFSSVGQYWDTEHMFTTGKNADGHWSYLVHTPDQWLPIDASGTTYYNGEIVTVDGAHDLADFLVDTGQMEWCWSREYFRYTLGRLEWDVDTESIEELAQSMRDGATLADAFKAIAHVPAFKTLYKPPVEQPSGQEP
jgi:chitodextrinase